MICNQGLIKFSVQFLSLIPFNPFPQTSYECSTPENLQAFSQILIKAGLITTTRKTRGDDIDAACGQLAGKVTDKTKRKLRRNNNETPINRMM